ncbi:hypothetical protein AXG93_1175s1320 [Marchantia polymorpha subsp. ruderalis]|uniref:Uncharacterized protein n=1 Tax=Marchantia polymorpha subsp. ruderalis TaxID=1480154 RepID=A0A176VP90_MARPO|nr:hypothetical protein AXG93_1175s1320 [Marchantia polymorpha subsp. ruderalis]
MAGGDRRDICHPWSSWDMTRGLARVVAHGVGDVFHAEVATKEGTETTSLDEMERDLIRSRILDLLEAGLVELSHDEYTSATVMPVKKNCKFFEEKVEYLGHVIYPDGLGVQQAKVEAIARIPRPTDIRSDNGDEQETAFVELMARLVSAPNIQWRMVQAVHASMDPLIDNL